MPVQVEYDFQYYKMEMPSDVPVLVLSQVTEIFLLAKKLFTTRAQTLLAVDPEWDVGLIFFHF